MGCKTQNKATALQKTVLNKQEMKRAHCEALLKLSRAVKAQGKASVHGNIGLHGFVAPAAVVRSVRILAQGNPEWKGQGDDAQGNAQHTRNWSYPSYSRSLHSAGQSRGRNLRTLLQLGDSACVLLRLGGLWPGLRGLAVRLPFVAFPAGVNAEGAMVFVNARGTRGGATERQVIEVHPPAAVPRVQRRVRRKAQGAGQAWAHGTRMKAAGRAQGCLERGPWLESRLLLSRQGIVWQVRGVGQCGTSGKGRALVPRLRRSLDLPRRSHRCGC